MIATSDLLRISLRQVIRQRAIGVILSIALGITAFIVLSVLGREIRYKVGQDMVLMGGVNIVQVFMDDHQFPGQPIREFFPETIEKIRSLPGVGLASVNSMGHVLPLRGSDDSSQSIHFIGIDELFYDVYSLAVSVGRTFTPEDVRQHRRVAMLGREAARTLYGTEEQALGKLLFLEKEVFEVIGVLNGVMLGSWGRGGFIPYTTMRDRNWGSSKVTRIFLRAVAWEDVPQLTKVIPSVVRECQDAPHLRLRTQEEQLERIKTTFMWVEALLWLGILASLMLGGFGIWYGTFASVRARTREVGLKKAMGGADIDILAQFLTEALCKSIAGGALGIMLGVLLVEIGAFSLDTGFSYSLLMASSIGSIFFSGVIGIAGGLYPAIQASKMDVVSALRFE